MKLLHLIDIMIHKDKEKKRKIERVEVNSQMTLFSSLSPSCPAPVPARAQ